MCNCPCTGAGWVGTVCAGLCRAGRAVPGSQQGRFSSGRLASHRFRILPNCLDRAKEEMDYSAKVIKKQG